MATASPVYEEPGMSIGRVFQRAFSAVSLNPAVILGLALVIGALPSLLMTYVSYKLGINSRGSLQNGGISTSGFVGAMFLSSLIMFVISALVQGALTRATVSANEGVRATFGQSMAAGFRVVLPLIGLSLLLVCGVGLGFILLIVPGIMLLMAWAVAVPSLVVEREGVIAAFKRSAELTKGARWKIFGLFLVLVVIYLLLSTLVGIVGLGMFNPAVSGFKITNVIGSVIVGTIFNTLWGTVQPSLYVELRQWKEGGSIDNLADVFA